MYYWYVANTKTQHRCTTLSLFTKGRKKWRKPTQTQENHPHRKPRARLKLTTFLLRGDCNNQCIINTYIKAAAAAAETIDCPIFFVCLIKWRSLYFPEKCSVRCHLQYFVVLFCFLLEMASTEKTGKISVLTLEQNSCLILMEVFAALMQLCHRRKHKIKVISWF